MTWTHPWFAWGLLSLPLIAWLAFWGRKQGPRLLHPGLPGGFRAPRSFRRNLSGLPMVLKVLACGCLLAVLVRPVVRKSLEEETTHGVDIVLVFDVSTSMQIHDVKPSRIEAAREVLKDFVKARSRDRMGLVAFAGRPVTRAPLTRDRDVLLDLIDSTSQEGLEDGTAIGDALLMAGNRLRKSDARSRVVVLLTDGESNMGAVDPVSAARALAAAGLRVYTIGFGTEGKFTQNFQLADGSQVKGTVDSKMDARTLSEVARIGGGRFWLARDGNALRAAYAQIDRLERTEIVSRAWYKVEEKFAALAVAALALLLSGVLLEWTWLRRSP